MTKNNPSIYNCYERAEADEPVFTLLGRDPTAAVLVRIWTILRRVSIASRSLNPSSQNDLDQIVEAEAIADAMEKWCVDKWKNPMRLGEAARALLTRVIP